MEPVRLWAAVEFTARSGSTEALLTAAARAGLHPYGVTALPGGFGGRCAAWQYPRLAALARKHRVRLRIRRKKQGLFLLRRLAAPGRALGRGLAVFLPLLLFAQQFVWLRRHLFPHHRTGCAGVCRSARGGPAARRCCDRSKARRRGIRPAAQRRVLMGQPEFCQRTAGSGSRCRKAQARHCRRDAAWHPGKMRRHCSAHEPRPAAPCWWCPGSRWRPDRVSLARRAVSATVR